MVTKVVFVLCVLLMGNSLYSQCYGKYVIKTQEDIDSFQTKHGFCKEIDTLVIVDYLGLINTLEPLIGVERISKLVIQADINNLRGLDSLKYIYHFKYENNYKVNSKPLKQLDTIIELEYHFNNQNIDLSLFNNLEHVRFLKLYNTGALEGMSSFLPDSIFSISFYNNDSIIGFKDLFRRGNPYELSLHFNDCNGIISLEGLEEQKRIGFIHFWTSNFTFSFESSLIDIDELSFVGCNNSNSFKRILKAIDSLEVLEIIGMNNLVAIDDLLPGLESIENSLVLLANKDLVDVSKFEFFNLPHRKDKLDIIGNNKCNIFVVNNPKLNYCKYDYFCRALEQYPDSVCLSGNGLNCTYDKLVEECDGFLATYEITDTICSGQSYIFGDSIILNSGIFIDTLQNIFNKDSLILMLNLRVIPIDTIRIDTLICQGNSIKIGDFEFSEEGVYQVELMNQFGCDSLVFVDIGFTDFEIDTVSIKPNYGCNSGAIDIEFNDTGSSYPHAFNWSNGEITEDIIGLSSGDYKLTITDSGNCFYEYSFIVPDSLAYIVPNAFFPDGKDEINSKFRIYLAQKSKLISTKVFNRWGEKVFQAKNNEFWDGTYKGQPVSPGVYLYQIVLDTPCGKQFEKGQILVLK